MENTMDLLPENSNFNHPYEPYDIQLQFMRALYSSLEEGKVAVFESPTGTGKSLSLICGSLTWLRDHKRREYQQSVDKTACDEDEPEWMREFAKRESSRAIAEKRSRLEARLANIRREEEKFKIAHESFEGPRKRQKFSAPSAGLEVQNEDSFALDDYESDGEEQSNQRVRSDQPGSLSASTLDLLEQFKGKLLTNSTEENDEEASTRIFYCSRTHSQLTQFVSELRRVAMPPSVPKELNLDLPGEELEERIKHLSLGSRRNLCINSKVAALESPTAINERCLELQQPGVAAQHKCPFLPSRNDEAPLLKFRDHALATVKDIEDLGNIGRKTGTCPYYASRSVIKHTEIVTLPYPLLLQRSAREALEISVKDHIVIIDEAHNLMDAISNIHSVTITLSQLQTSISQLTTYARKFKTRLKGKNRAYIAQVIRLVSSIADYLRSLENISAPEGCVQSSDLMAGRGADQINPYKLSRYLQESKLARKVDGYVAFSREKADHQPHSKSATPVLFHIQSFLLSLMNPSAEGRLFYSRTPDDIQLKYMLLDPTNHFKEIVEDARAVILAGGTMSPMADYSHHLFSYVPPHRLSTFSYGHVIPSKNLIAHTLAKGILGSDFDFTYENRHSDKIIADLGRTIAAFCQVIPDGVVAFFPSFDYLHRVISTWKKPIQGDKNQTVYDLIERKKPIVYESRDMTVSTEELLQDYARAIDSGRGALLLSVVGGKLSEGINFSDKLGRGVLIVGLPFPNIHSAVWQAKIQYVEQKAFAQSSGTNRQSAATTAGREFYENACMRAVNQSIGRAIRHQNDYAAIVLIDKRYHNASVQGKLPAWIKQSMASTSAQRSAGETIGSLSKFFIGRRGEQKGR